MINFSFSRFGGPLTFFGLQALAGQCLFNGLDPDSVTRLFCRANGSEKRVAQRLSENMLAASFDSHQIVLSDGFCPLLQLKPLQFTAIWGSPCEFGPPTELIPTAGSRLGRGPAFETPDSQTIHGTEQVVYPASNQQRKRNVWPLKIP